MHTLMRNPFRRRYELVMNIEGDISTRQYWRRFRAIDSGVTLSRAFNIARDSSNFPYYCWEFTVYQDSNIIWHRRGSKE